MNGITKKMISTITHSKCDIVLVPFPFTDLSAFKKRPALIISPDEYNKHNDIVIVFITSNIPAEFRFVL